MTDAENNTNELLQLIALGERLYDEADFENARLAFERAIEIKPDRPEAAGGLARVLLIEGAYVDATNLLEAAMTNGLPHSAENLCTLGICYTFVRDADRARDLFEAAIVEDADYEPTYGAVARLCLQERDLPASEFFATEGLNRFPTNTPCLEARAEARFLSFDLDGAEADTDEALRLEPELIDVMLCKAAIRMAREDADSALQLLTHAAELEPQNPDVWIALGGTFAAQLDLDQSELCFTEAQKIDLEDSRSYQGLASVAFARRDWDKTLELLDTATELGSEDPGVNFLRGSALVQLDRPELAKPEFETAIERNPFDVLSLVSLAEIESESSFNKKGARDLARRVLELGEEGFAADRARRVLERVK